MGNFEPIVSALVSFLVCAVMGIPFIPYLKRLKYGQTILDEGPKWHKSKQGTPTMGGILIISGMLVGLLFAFGFSYLTDKSLFDEMRNSIKLTSLIAGVLFALMCGFIGWMDDYIKVVKKRNLGLTAKQKTALQLLATAAYLSALALGGMDTTWIPFVGDVSITSGFGLLFWPVSFVFIYYIVNAVNLTDGIDGLATSVTLVVSCAFILIAGRVNMLAMNTLSAALGGGCAGFLLWNSKPAKVFMGDTGSMFLGGVLVAIAFGIGRPILLIFAGILYILEALSVVLQVFWYKRTKKRIFKMSPIHHHFEMSGWSEEKICFVFSFVALIGCIISALPVYFGW